MITRWLNMKPINCILIFTTLLLVLCLATGSPDEATGRVSEMVDGDTLDVQFQTHDSRIIEDLIRIRLQILIVLRYAVLKPVMPERRQQAIRDRGYWIRTCS
jgi:endonuclease YncB( thermonuclease family)